MGKNKKLEIVLIGASTGGPKAIERVVTNLPRLNVPILVVQHMPKGFTTSFAERLNKISELRVVEAENGMIIEKNTVYIAQGGKHMEVTQSKRIELNEEPPIWGVRPAVDRLFNSATKVYHDKIVSVILTGMGKDGAEGSVKVKEAKGITIAEDKSTAIIYGMPKAAYETGAIDYVLPLNKIPDKLIGLILGGE